VNRIEGICSTVRQLLAAGTMPNLIIKCARPKKFARELSVHLPEFQVTVVKQTKDQAVQVSLRPEASSLHGHAEDLREVDSLRR
jgi:hypothetical protein